MMLFDTLDVNEKAQKFRKNRLKKICKGKVWGPLDEAPHCVLHWLPVSEKTLFKPSILSPMEFSKFIQMQGKTAETPNMDGVRFYSRASKENGEGFLWNAQVFHSGALEIAFKLLFNEDDTVKVRKIAQGVLVKNLRNLMDGFKECMSSFKIDAPIIIGVSLLNASNYGFYTNNYIEFLGTYPRSDREQIILPEVLMDNLDGMEEIEQQIFDMLWRSFGLLKCEYYDENGKRESIG